ncbi:hypothetical protein L596_024051 [Steinernema carpocapsae]|uniref:Uncharacterized protein n=1 Tax=Steinernema carpocapsae TaxID=34508 RepID=A0A4U5MFL0_STECR|nr:hypothetical protein L596_024051 [Steinernema carpocapsae]
MAESSTSPDDPEFPIPTMDPFNVFAENWISLACLISTLMSILGVFLWKTRHHTDEESEDSSDNLDEDSKTTKKSAER